MKYLSTILVLIALVGFVLGFSAYLRMSAQMLEDGRLASVHLKVKTKHRRRHPSAMQAGAAPAIPMEELVLPMEELSY